MEKLEFTGSLEMISKRLSFYKDNGVYDCTVSLHHEKRSRNANNYLWALVGELGNALRMSKEEVYFEMLQRYGQSEQVAVKAGIDISKAVKYCQKGDTINGWTYWKIYTGSSEMNSEQMSILLDGVVQECEQQDIPTLDSEMIEDLERSWNA